MLIDVNELPSNAVIDCDICIAGSGPAGLTLASELERTALRVCLFESGGLDAAVPASSVAEQLGVLVDLAKFERRSFGGASSQWGGVRGRWFRSRPMDAIDFEVRPWVANSGWPFSHRELEPFFERAGKIFKVPSYENFGAEAHHNHLAAEFHNNDLKTMIFQTIRPLRFGEHYREMLSKSINITLYTNGNVVQIEEDQSAPIIRSLHVASASGTHHRIHARYFVLACGGLENPRLLLVSRRKTASGIGNEHDQVGRYYMQHPKGMHGIAVLNLKSLRAPLYTHGYLANDVLICGGISFSEEFQRREGVLNHCIMFRPIFALSQSYFSEAYRALLRSWRGRDDKRAAYRKVLDGTKIWATALQRRTRGSGPYTIVGIQNHMEQIPKPESRLDLSERKDRFGVNQLRVDWRIDPLEKESLCRLHQVVHDHLARECSGTLESHLDPHANDWPVSGDSAHHLGTTRMHADPRLGVTDANCQVHGVRNLFIGGTSVFPTSGCANPTFTLVALGIRLADHLKSLP